jgi:GTP-binding protein
MDLRNVAIIAHVDHGKTTLVDSILRQTGVFRENQQAPERVLDSNDLEKERGITILAKNTAVFYRDVKINIVDTPGHSDFSGEVERIIGMVDGALLIVDAAEGPLPQTRYVLQKALQKKIAIILLINKIDRKDARPQETLDAVIDLFIELGADVDQLEFPVIWASSRWGVADNDLNRAMELVNKNQPQIQPLLDCILTNVPAPSVDENGPLQMLVYNLDYDDYVGRIALGRIQRGVIKQGQDVVLCRSDSPSMSQGKITYLYNFARLQREKIKEAPAGEIVAVAGIEEISIGDTICDSACIEPLQVLDVDEPTLKVIFRVNDGPFAGRDGKYIRSVQLKERLWKEARTNIALKVTETDSPDAFEVCGRGELHLGVLMETMRREGYEFTVSKPQPILKTVNGQVLEPMEIAHVEVPTDYVGTVIELLGARKAEMIDLTQTNDAAKLKFIVPARSLVGFRSTFLTETKGYGVIYHSFYGYLPYRGEIPERISGSIVACVEGVATSFAILNIQQRSELFVSPGTEVYEGMIVGENSRPQDLDVNIAKKKHLTNMRSSTSDIVEGINPPRIMNLEEALSFIATDELIEVTPKNIRLRKAVLSSTKRGVHKKRELAD